MKISILIIMASMLSASVQTNAQSTLSREVYHFECTIRQTLNIPFVFEGDRLLASESERLDDTSNGLNGQIYRSGRFFVNRLTGEVLSDFTFTREGQDGIERTKVVFGPTGDEGERVLLSTGGSEAPFEAVYWSGSRRTKATLLRIQTYYDGKHKPFIAVGSLSGVYYGVCVVL